jgi:hypothetical protein
MSLFFQESCGHFLVHQIVFRQQDLEVALICDHCDGGDRMFDRVQLSKHGKFDCLQVDGLIQALFEVNKGVIRPIASAEVLPA